MTSSAVMVLQREPRFPRVRRLERLRRGEADRLIRGGVRGQIVLPARRELAGVQQLRRHLREGRIIGEARPERQPPDERAHGALELGVLALARDGHHDGLVVSGQAADQDMPGRLDERCARQPVAHGGPVDVAQRSRGEWDVNRLDRPR